MRYSNKLTRQIYEELIKMPNIRYVCQKVGIDHSTFYRWQSKHHLFSQLVRGALVMGRDRITDSAEAVIISGIQNNDFKSASYWLSHNSARYANTEKIEYLSKINSALLQTLAEPTPENSSESTFDQLFEIYFATEDIFGEKRAREKMHSLIELVGYEDQELIDIFYATYAEYKKNRIEKAELGLRAHDDLPKD